MTQRRSRLAGATIAAAGLAAVASAQVQVARQWVATVDAPTDLAAPRHDLRRLFVAEGRGRVWVIKDGQQLAVPFLDLRSQVEANGAEQGLLGLAFHPHYNAKPHVFVSFTRRPDNALTVLRFTASPSNPDVADPSSALEILTVAQTSTQHNGGALRFGWDRYLYISLGDSVSGCVAQDGSTMLGKILRLDVDAATPYAIPPDNPFAGSPTVLEEIWAMGFRNPWRIGFDDNTGDLYVADVGALTREEVSVVPAGGLNFGWPLFEGSLTFSPTGCGSTPAVVAPVVEYDHAPDRCCVIGGSVYRGAAIPALRGTYFYADYCGGISSFRYVPGAGVRERVDRSEELGVAGRLPRVSSFGEDGAGELCYAQQADGQIYRIVAAAATSRRQRPQGLGPAWRALWRLWSR
ncbi:MAG: PQQ-dependent sugar dehydrogenase [Planctomycetota bacterium]